jgi:hypothetical protein
MQSFFEVESDTKCELGMILETIHGPLDLIIDNDLIVMLNRIAGFSFLKVFPFTVTRNLQEHGVAKVYKLGGEFGDSSEHK